MATEAAGMLGITTTQGSASTFTYNPVPDTPESEHIPFGLYFGGHTCWCLEITPGYAQGATAMLKSEPRSAVCKDPTH